MNGKLGWMETFADLLGGWEKRAHVRERRRMKKVRWALGMLILLAACHPAGGPLQPTMGGGVIGGPAPTLPVVDYHVYGNPPIPARILLFIPKEFEETLYTSMFLGKAYHHLLGMEGERELRTALEIQFSEVRVQPVQNEALAREMIHQNKASAFGSFDYWVFPRFVQVGSSDQNEEYHFRIELVVEFVALDGSSIRITGRGESVTGKYVVATPEKSVELTLRTAVLAILERIEKKRSFFERR